MSWRPISIWATGMMTGVGLDGPRELCRDPGPDQRV